MNIFVLDKNPKKAAEYHCDKHVCKMCIEYAQLLSTALHITGSPLNDYVYASTHENHPCTIWVSESQAHWKWLWLLGHHLGNEYTKRYGKIHKSTRVLRNLPMPNKLIECEWLRQWPQAMPDEYKSEDAVKSYRNFYLKDKARFAEWNHSNPPEWWNTTEERNHV